MKKFSYHLSVFQVSPTDENRWLDYACRHVMMTLVECDKIIRHPVKLASPIIFECEAENILEADKMMISETGINPVKRPDIGCRCA